VPELMAILVVKVLQDIQDHKVLKVILDLKVVSVILDHPVPMAHQSRSLIV